MDATIERLDGGDALRRTAEITLAGLLQDVGKVFQRADWQLSQAAERMQEDLCPLVEGRHVHRHILWTYDFCNDHLKWLADYVDLARVIRLAISHHKAAPDDAAALILDAADRLAGGRDDIEIEELQPVIPPQVPLESILWGIAGRLAPAPAEEAATPDNNKRKSRRVRRSHTSSSEAGQTGPAAGGEQPAAEAAGPIVRVEITVPDEHFDAVMADLQSRRAQVTETLVRFDRRVIRALVPEVETIGYSMILENLTQKQGAWAMEPLPSAVEGTEPAGAPVAREGAVEQHGQFPEAEVAQAALQRHGYFKAQVLRPDEDVLPVAKRPEMNEEDYRGIGTGAGGGLPEDRAAVDAAADRVAHRGAAHRPGASRVVGAGVRGDRRADGEPVQPRGGTGGDRGGAVGAGTRTRAACRAPSRSR